MDRLSPETIRTNLARVVPFNRYLGTELVEVADGRGVMRIDQRYELLNHLGTLHAAALFALGEGASGAALVGALAGDIERLVPVFQSATIGELKPARGTITAVATLLGAEAFLAMVGRHAPATATLHVTLTDEMGEQVGEMTAEWLVKCAPNCD